MAEFFLGIDLGGTFVKAAAVSKDKTILGKQSAPTQAHRGPEGVMDVMAQTAQDVLRQAGVSGAGPAAAGIGAPGPMDWRSGIVFSPPNLPGWKNVSLAEGMERRLNCPCFVDNDANAACFGEYWLGAGRGCRSLCLLTLGTGVGGGIVIDNQLLRGIDGTAAEIGHLKVQRDGRLCGCGARGCLEAYGSVSGMAATAAEGLEAGRKSVLSDRCNNDCGALTGLMISECAEEGDAFAQEVLAETGRWIGLGIASLVNLLNPERVVLCGGMIAAGERLFRPIRGAVRENAFEVPANRVEIVAAGLGADSGVLGAAGCAAGRFKNTGA